MNLDKMTLAQLQDLRLKVEAEILRAKAREAGAIREEMARLVKDRGLTLQEVIETLAKSAQRTVPVKYRDPNNASHEWSGRGRRPNWFNPRHPDRYKVAV